MVYRRLLFVMLVIIVAGNLVGLPVQSLAEEQLTSPEKEQSPFMAGVRIGASFGDDDEDFQQYDLFLVTQLPWGIEFDEGWRLEPAVDVTLSVLHGEDETGGKVSGALDLYLFSPERTVSFMAGLGAGLMEEEVYGTVDFGGPLFFVFQAGVSYWLNPSMSIGYRYHHQSNGSIYDRNPSLNLHQLELCFHF